MKYLFTLVLLLPVTLVAQLRDGVYSGVERMSHRDGWPRHWYRLHTVHVKNDSISVYKCAVTIKRKDTAHSASDGAFYWYFGKINKTGQSPMVKMYMTKCDYCPVREDGQVDTFNYEMILTSDGFIMDGVHFGWKRPLNEFHMIPHID